MSTETLNRSTTLLERPVAKERYDNFIGGKFVPPVQGKYFDVIS